MKWPDFEYMRWAKGQPKAPINLARSGVELCPLSVLGATRRDLVISHPPGYGWLPLRRAIGRRYRVSADSVFPVSGGTSLANWVAIAAALDGAPRGSEVIVERPTYEPLLRVPQALGHRVRRMNRRWQDDWAVDLDRFARLVTQKTRLAVVSNLHNPSGALIPDATLRAMAMRLAEVGGYLLVDEVYAECLWRGRTSSAVHTGPNVITTNSLTKAYGLDGLRQGWMLGPADLVERAGWIHDLLGVNGVAPGEQLSLLAFRKLKAVVTRAHRFLDEGLATLREWLEAERRLKVSVPPGGNVVFPRLPAGVDADRLAERLRTRYGTLVVPGRFFEAPRHVRLSFGIGARKLKRGLENVSRAL